jgi:hypothetical protein
VCLDHTDGSVNGRTPIPVKTTSAPGAEMSHRHPLIVTIKYNFLTIIRLLIRNGRATVEEICVSDTVSGVPTPVGTRPRRDQPRRGSGARTSTAGKPRVMPATSRCASSGRGKRAFESGGASLVQGPAQLPALTCAAMGDTPQVKQGALRVGEDLTVTSGSVVYRDALREVIQSVVAY